MRGGREGSSGSPRNLGRAIRYLVRYKKEAGLAYGAVIIATLAQLTVPQLVQNIIDAVTDGLIASRVLELSGDLQGLAAQQLGITIEQLKANSQGAERALISAGGLILVFAIIRALFSFTQAYMGERASQSVSFDFRNELFAKIQRLSFSYHDRHRTGQLMIRATDDVEKVRLFIGQGLLMAVQALILMIGTLVILFLTNVRLTMIILPILPVAMILFMAFGAIARPMFETVQRKLSALNGILQENLAGIRVVKAFNREQRQQAHFDAAAEDYMNGLLRVMRLMTFLFPAIFLLANLGQALILFYGGRQIIGGSLTLGEYQKFSLYLVFIFVPVGQLGFIISQMAQAAASAGRIFEILDARQEVEDQPGARPLPPIEGRVAFEAVSFRYFGTEAPVLNQVSFVAEPGQTIALLGMTGSGKSTLINLIPRFYDPTEGRVLIDGHDLGTVKLDSLREQIGIVLQETTLFAGTIRDNIAFGRSDASLEQVTAAASAAAAHEFILEFPQGYETSVGERGASLSGGQKQRVAIARALLLDPRILILDDSTSSVDLQTEYLIQQALDRLMVGRTSFVIAQRISTVLNADQILVLDKGQIAAQGTHEQLLERSEIYAEIYHSQLVEDTELAPAGESVSLEA
ncbi:MAG: ABC transporter ATP-binding protein [Chloroflexi bacterium]|nr:ABC transporter ATP-binding protein [Chloroflexota bacterium]MCH8876740.1 ABC transporter ATP-binding protein [Chloroflexota bacterium]MCI0773733.1 ABC transporter ATP-binding protein [Chloroflexota bacterium]MCI0807158.1 ABC transporter ATP-binding protein [Chloroflexota bacterium]MCI0828039.1 ABC transporter ATP-binding protein [Chloroflexota bacterium]